MRDPAAVADSGNWCGGYYELAIELGVTSDERLDRTLGALWRIAGIDGCIPSRGGERDDGRVVVPTAAAVEQHGHLRGVVGLPGGRRVVCCAFTSRSAEDDTDWLDFCLPLGALGRVDRRIGGYPFGPDGGPGSLVWRAPLDARLADIGRQLYQVVDFRLGVVGFDALGEVESSDLAGDRPPPPCFGYLMPDPTGLRYLPATA